MRSQARSKRQVSGKKYISFRNKRSCELGGLSALTHIGNKRIKVKRTLGGNSKSQLLSEETVNVNDGKKTVKAKIETVVSNPANIHYTRRNVITKGSIVKTDKGDVKITSRPGQGATLFGVLIK
jgi:small subunit ribosomal protein S8e